MFAVSPMIAAVGASARATAWVGAISVLAGIVLTLLLRGDELAVQDLVRVLTVLTVAVLATWAAGLRGRRVRATFAASEARGRLDVAFERAPVGLAFFDREGRYLRVNERLAEMDGVPVEAHLGRTTPEVLPRMAPSVPIDLRRVWETGEPLVDVEVRGETPASPGAEREFLVSYWPVRVGGAITELGAVVHDVTRRRATERALRAETARYETLLRALGDAGEGLVVMEGERMVFANDAFVAITAHTPESLGDDPFTIVVPEQREPARTALARGELRQEFTVRHRDGHLLDLDVTGVPLSTEGREQVVLVVRDVTARRRAEAEREALLAAEREARAEAEAAERRAEFLAAMSASLEEGLSGERTGERIARATVRDFATTCVLWLGPASEPELMAAAASTPARERILAQLEAEYPLARERALVELLRTSGPRVVREPQVDTLGRDNRHTELLRALGTPVLLLVPLRARGRELGRLVAGFGDLAEAEEPVTLELFAEVARRAALALDNARLYEERSAIARTLQRSLLPAELPALPGMELAARYVAAGEGNEVGGDFYDAFSLGGEDWALVMGDVCGKGAEAAAVTALARYTIRASVLHSSHPRDVLAELNEVLLRQGLEFRFASVLFATVRLREAGATVTLASGGHPLPLVLRADGRVEEAGRPGTLLGIVPTPNLDAATLELGPGDALVLYTDGVIEASPVDDAFGPERFAAFLAGLAGEDAGALADRIERAVLGIQDGRPRDDVAVLVLRPAPFPAVLPGVPAAA